MLHRVSHLADGVRVGGGAGHAAAAVAVELLVGVAGDGLESRVDEDDWRARQSHVGDQHADAHGLDGRDEEAQPAVRVVRQRRAARGDQLRKANLKQGTTHQAGGGSLSVARSLSRYIYIYIYIYICICRVGECTHNSM